MCSQGISFLYVFYFHSETMRLDTGLIVELWNKGMLWDKLLGTHWLPLMSVHHSNQVCRYGDNNKLRLNMFSYMQVDFCVCTVISCFMLQVL